jgi:hypothetical protein
MYTSQRHICKLRKALYGLKQAPRIWYNTLQKALQDMGFRRSAYDEAVFIRKDVILVAYVDDLLLFGPDRTLIEQVKQQLKGRFEMSDLGPCEHFLGIQITRDRPNKKLWLSHSTYLQRVLQRLGWKDITPKAIPLTTGESLQPSL